MAIPNPNLMGNANKRNTRQRQAVITELNARNEFRSAQRIHEDLASHGERMGLATVYRNLRMMAAEGELDVLMAPDGEALYRRCDRGSHHHHLVCRSCLRTEEIGGQAVESWIHSLAERYGFTQLEHSVEVFGVCANCSAQVSESPQPAPDEVPLGPDLSSAE